MKTCNFSEMYDTREFINELFFLATTEEFVDSLTKLYFSVTRMALSFNNLGDIGICPEELREEVCNIIAMIDAIRLVKRKEEVTK